MKTADISKLLFFIVTYFFLFPMLCFAGYRYEIEPRISVQQVYDDNIYLDSADEESDYLISVSPGINMNISSQNSSLSLDYSPAWVWYHTNDENNTVRHYGTLSYGQILTQHVKLDLTNTYLKSEAPLEEIEDIEEVRRTRNTYQRNMADASLEYQFGLEDALTFGYRHSLLENEDVTIDDGTVQSPFAEINYWLNERNGLELNYEFTDANFSRDDDATPGDDYAGHSADIRYIYRFTPHIKGSVGYAFTNRDFDGLTEDYAIHEGIVGLEYSLSPTLSLSLEGGIFALKNEESDDETGSVYKASLEKRSERWSVTIGAKGGWDETYLEAERRGLTTYWSADSGLEYRFMQRLNGYANVSFRQDEDVEDREWATFRGNCGLEWEFLDLFSLSLDYFYTQRNDDVDTDEYKVNRVMLTLTTSKLWKW